MNDLLFWGFAVLASLFVGAGKGGLPAIALLSVPLLSLIMAPMTAAALLLPVYIVSDVYGLYLYRRSFSRRNLLILFPASLLGIAAGWLLADWTDENTIRLVIGLIGLGFVALRIVTRLRGSAKARPAKVGPGIVWGALSGFTSFVAHAGGPAFQIYTLPQKLPKMEFAGTATILFALINLAKVPPYFALGLMETNQMLAASALAPVAVFGAWIGYRLILIIPEKVFFFLIEAALLALSIMLIATSVLG